MKKILLSSILSLVLFAAAYAQPACISDYKINNGGGNCPVVGGQQATGSLTLTFTFDIDPNALPEVIKAVDVTDPNNPIDVIDVTFIPNTWSTTKDEVTYCYYIGPNNNNNLQGANNNFEFVISYLVNGSPFICGNEDIPLPVHFSSFNANRQNSSVAITWTTATEINNKGFYIQRNVNGIWTNVAFVFSQADGGNSSSTLTYEYKDVNTESGISQYRIQQVDIDGHTRFTDIRAVRGEGQASKLIVYPNPSVNGNLNVVFEDNNSLRDVFVNDIQGKIIRQYKQVSGNLLLIEKLTSGFYTIKVTNRTTAASSVQKVVIK